MAKKSSVSKFSVPSSSGKHIPVLLHEAIDGLALRLGMVVLDATLGGGGHTEAIACAIGVDGTIIGLDADIEAIERVGTRLASYHLHKFLRLANFRDVEAVLVALETTSLDAALFDLGLSSFQLEASGRGFSFERDEPLFMTFDARPTGAKMTARSLLAQATEEELMTMFFGSGERYARRIAGAIVERREHGPIESSRELAELVLSSVPGSAKRGRLHPATKVFQAIRMSVNDELSALKEGLVAAWSHLVPGGRMAVISFHSNEDRVVKQFGRERIAQGSAQSLHRKPIVPSQDEIIANPRSRSAKLRVFEKVH